MFSVHLPAILQNAHSSAILVWYKSREGFLPIGPSDPIVTDMQEDLVNNAQMLLGENKILLCLATRNEPGHKIITAEVCA